MHERESTSCIDIEGPDRREIAGLRATLGSAQEDCSSLARSGKIWQDAVAAGQIFH